jgi:hypothetical protein
MANRPKQTPKIVGKSPVSAFPAVGTDADDAMSEKQAVILRDLALKAGEPYEGNLTRAQADERIEALRAQLKE